MEKRQIPSWLKNLQENSWELELLISGGAIFSLFQVSDFYIEAFGSLRTIMIIPGTNVLFMIGMIAIKVLTLGFVIHLVLRAYWLSLVCINYVYPNGVIKDKIKWKKPFKIKTENNSDLEEHITKIDKQCGTVIFMSIISVFSIIGFCLIFITLIAVMSFIVNEYYSNYIEIIFYTFFLFVPFYLFDFLTFGLLRKIPGLSYVIFPIFKLYDIISFRGFYQQPLWLFNTNVKKLKFFFSAIVFSAFAITLAYLSVYKSMHWPNLFDQREYRWQMSDNDYIFNGTYMDEWKDNKTYGIGINSKIQKSNYMELFVAYEKAYDNLIMKTSSIDSLRSFDKILSVKIDSTLQQNLKWFPSNKENTVGVTTFIPIDSLSNGTHTLVVWADTQYDNQHQDLGYQAKIPFLVDR